MLDNVCAPETGIISDGWTGYEYCISETHSRGEGGITKTNAISPNCPYKQLSFISLALRVIVAYVVSFFLLL